MKIVAILWIIATLSYPVQSAPASTEMNFSKEYIDGFTLLLKSMMKNVKPEQNLVISPSNIYSILLHLNLGATGETRNELNTCVSLPDDQERLLEHIFYYNLIFYQLQKSDTVQLIISNSMFVPQGTQLKTGYVTSPIKYLENNLQEVDFAKGGSEAADAFNNWVSKNTKTHGTQALKHQLPKTTQLIASSVLFFNATWKQPFNKQNTKNEIFNTGVRQIQVPTMNQIGNVLYKRNVDKKFEVIGIPFDDEKYTVFVFLPFEHGTFPVYTSSYNVEVMNMIRENRTSYVDYKLPRFRIGGFVSLKDHLMKIGVERIFKRAEFGNMLENGGHLSVSDMNYVAEFQVNEDGVRTADSSPMEKTAEVAYTPSIPHSELEPVKFYANRPFVFSISATGRFIHGSVFDGIVSNPLSDE